MSAFLGVPVDTAYHLVFGLATVLSPVWELAAAARSCCSRWPSV
jgi:hypothetical protein